MESTHLDSRLRVVLHVDQQDHFVDRQSVLLNVDRSSLTIATLDGGRFDPFASDKYPVNRRATSFVSRFTCARYLILERMRESCVGVYQCGVVPRGASALTVNSASVCHNLLAFIKV